MQKNKKSKQMKTIHLKRSLNVEFTPRDVKFPKYMLPATFSDSNAEEIVARYITICQKENEWVGISLRSFVEVLDKDFIDIDDVSKRVYTHILQNCYKPNHSHPVRKGFRHLMHDSYIIWETYEGEKYILPTEKLLHAVERYVSC